MNKKLIFMGIGATILALLAGGKVRANAVFANDLLAKWKGVNETDPRIQNLLIDMWKAAGLSESQAKQFSYKQAWSAAFISYVMIKSGYKNFPVSTMHSCFAAKIKAGNYPEFELKRVNNYAPQVGDILMLNRNGGKLTYDSFRCGDSSHSDIVTKIENGYCHTVGANLSNQIMERKVRQNANGTINNSLYFAIIKVK